MNISKRLRVIGNFIADNSFILDVGCDHALLDVYAVMNKKNVKAIASDVKEGPLKGAINNVKKYGFDDKIKLVLADGLDAYFPMVDTIILSGLGSSTIIDILIKGKDVLSKVDRLIISSNNDYYLLRKSICELGFYIFDEEIVFENGKYYPIIVFENGYCCYDDFNLKYGPILFKKMSDTFIQYLKHSRDKLMVICDLLGDSDNVRKEKLLKEMALIDEIFSK